MKRPSIPAALTALAAFAAMAVLAASCVSQPPAPEAAAQKVRKERIEEFRTPVVLKETLRFADGLVDRIVEYSYDDGYRHLLSTVARKPSSPDPIERVAVEYRDGLPASRSTFGPDGAMTTRSDYAYTDGRLVRETILDGRGLVQSTSEWTWDNGRASSWRVLSAAGLVLARTDYFSVGDALAKAELFDGAGNPKGRIEYAYGDKGLLVAVSYLTASGSPDGRVDYAYKDGLVAQESVYRADGRLERRLACEYGSDGALLVKTLYDASGKARETTVYENAYRIDTRVIVYYE